MAASCRKAPPQAVCDACRAANDKCTYPNGYPICSYAGIYDPELTLEERASRITDYVFRSKQPYSLAIPPELSELLLPIGQAVHA